MRLKTAIAALLAPLALASACAGARADGPPRDPRDVRGEHLYRVSCAGCHRLRDPAELTAAGWEKAVDDHRKDAELSRADEALIRAYLVRHAAGARGEGANAPARALR